MTTSTDILDGTETIFSYIMRNRKFIIIAVILVIAVILIKRGGKK